MTEATTTIVIPCYNESAVIVSTLERLASWFPHARLLVVDDGSADDTAAKAEGVATRLPQVRVVRRARNGGKGQAVIDASAYLAGDGAVIVDADLAYRRESIARAMAELAHADVVIGNRRHEGSTYAVPVRLFGFLYRRHVLGLTLNAVVRPLLGLPHKDTQCGLKAFRTDAYRRLMSRVETSGFAFDLEVLLAAQATGLRVHEVPVEVTYDSGRSSVRLAKDGFRLAQALVRLTWRRVRGVYRAGAE